MMQELCEDSM